jgi:hypothetical protein
MLNAKWQHVTFLSSSSYIATDSLSPNLFWCWAPIRSLRSHCITVEHLRSSCFESPSLTRGRVCNLLVQYTVTLWSKSCRTHYHILLSHLRLPQRGGPGHRIYIPRKQGSPVIPLGIGFPSRRLLRLAGLRWRYSNPPPHGSLSCRSSTSFLFPTADPMESIKDYYIHSVLLPVCKYIWHLTPVKQTRSYCVRFLSATRILILAILNRVSIF